MGLVINVELQFPLKAVGLVRANVFLSPSVHFSPKPTVLLPTSESTSDEAKAD